MSARIRANRTARQARQDRFYERECMFGRHHALLSDRTGARRCLDCGGTA